jgi:Zn-dependent protease with chaperone function
VADDHVPTPEELEELQRQLADFGVDQLLASAASTVASLAYAKLERQDLPQAKKAIDALASLVPHVEGELAGDLKLALSRLQVAYADAVSA